MASETHRVGSAASPPGRMTWVMRAAHAGGPLVLRMAWVKAGRVVEERILKPRTTVTVGSGETNTFVVDAPGFPSTFCLLEASGGDYLLGLRDGMQGRLVLPSGVADVATLTARRGDDRDGVHRVRLGQDFRGMVAVGDSTFLFQLVVAPPEAPRAQLPVSVLRGATSVDWRTTMVAAASFLAHFFVIGTAYSDWLDPVVDDRIDVAGLVESVHPLPGPEVEVEDVDQQVVRHDDQPPSNVERPPSPASTAQNRPPSTEQPSAALVAGQLETVMQTLGALSTTRTATSGVPHARRGPDERPRRGRTREYPGGLRPRARPGGHPAVARAPRGAQPDRSDERCRGAKHG